MCFGVFLQIGFRCEYRLANLARETFALKFNETYGSCHLLSILDGSLPSAACVAVTKFSFISTSVGFWANQGS